MSNIQPSFVSLSAILIGSCSDSTIPCSARWPNLGILWVGNFHFSGQPDGISTAKSWFEKWGYPK